MPFTIDGRWIPSPPPTESQNVPKLPKKPVKVRLVRKGNNLITTILNLNMNSKEMDDLASGIKKKLGCGGAVKGDEVEIQGDKVKVIQKYLLELGIKSS